MHLEEEKRLKRMVGSENFKLKEGEDFSIDTTDVEVLAKIVPEGKQWDVKVAVTIVETDKEPEPEPAPVVEPEPVAEPEPEGEPEE